MPRKFCRSKRPSCSCRRPRKSGPKPTRTWMLSWQSWASKDGEMADKTSPADTNGMNREVPDEWRRTDLGSLLREDLRNGHSAKGTSNGQGIRTLTLTSVTKKNFSLAN